MKNFNHIWFTSTLSKHWKKCWKRETINKLLWKTIQLYSTSKMSLVVHECLIYKFMAHMSEVMRLLMVVCSFWKCNAHLYIVTRRLTGLVFVSAFLTGCSLLFTSVGLGQRVVIICTLAIPLPSFWEAQLTGYFC